MNSNEYPGTTACQLGSVPAGLVSTTAPTSTLSLAPSPSPIRLDLGCGQSPKDGFDGVDKYAPDAKHKVDLFTFPWPFEDNSVDEVHCSHFIEHIPLRDVEARDIVSSGGHGYVGHDMLLVFFDELYRILKPTGKATIVWPALQSKRAFQDPTHRRFIPDFTMAYLSKSERKGMRLDHYPVSCDFVANVGYSAPDTLSLLHPEAAARRMHEGWNVIYDYIATLTPIK